MSEVKTVAIEETKKVAAKKVVAKSAVKAEVKKPEVKKAEVKKETVENTKKENLQLNIQDVNNMYLELGIKCYNPEGKGKYRIMGSKKGSSLNLTKTEIKIYSTEEDTILVQEAQLNGLKGVEVVRGDNSQDKSRPNTILCDKVETLKELLKVYAANVFNQVAKETATK